MPRPAPQSMRSGQPNVAMPGPSRQQVKPTGLIIPRAKVMMSIFQIVVESIYLFVQVFLKTKQKLR